MTIFGSSETIRPISYVAEVYEFTKETLQV